MAVLDFSNLFSCFSLHTLFILVYHVYRVASCNDVNKWRWSVSESLGEGAGDDAGVKELQELRDKYEGKLTAFLYTGTLCVAAVASLIALGALCSTDYRVSTAADPP